MKNAIPYARLSMENSIFFVDLIYEEIKSMENSILIFFVKPIYEEMKSMEISILTYLIRFLFLFYM
jgi:hypothetical protein